MRNIMAYGSAVVLAAILAASPGLAAPPAGPPAVTHDANVWDGYDHQTDRATQHRLERAAGVRPTAQQRRHQQRVTDRLNRQLLGTEGRAAVPPPP